MNLYLPTQQYCGSYEPLFTDTVELVFIWTPINRHRIIGVYMNPYLPRQFFPFTIHDLSLHLYPD